MYIYCLDQDGLPTTSHIKRVGYVVYLSCPVELSLWLRTFPDCYYTFLHRFPFNWWYTLLRLFRFIVTDEKIALANNLADLVGKYYRRLDQELHKFKMELEADNMGITEILEKRKFIYSLYCDFFFTESVSERYIYI